MKNIHILPTDKPSRLGYIFDNLILNSKLLSPTLYKNQNIYITNSEKPKAGEWFYVKTPNIYGGNIVAKCLGFGKYSWSENILTDTTDEKGYHPSHCVKIILTDNKDLIKDGVQAIDDEFLQWFVKNPSCEWVEIELFPKFSNNLYGIIIPKEKPKQYPSIHCDEACYYHCTKGGNQPPDCEKEKPKLINNCHKCGLDLVERAGCKPVCTRIDCGGIILSNETLKEWALKEEPKQTDENGKPITYWGGLEKPKQETLEEAAERMYPINSTGGVMEMLNKHQLNNSYKQEGFIAGAKWQQEQEKNNYSEEEVFNLLNNFNKDTLKLRSLKLGNSFNVKDWFSQFKNQEDGND